MEMKRWRKKNRNLQLEIYFGIHLEANDESVGTKSLSASVCVPPA